MTAWSKWLTMQRKEHTLADFHTLGILDSGVGGLSALKKLLESCPYDSIIYYGDTANVPYGEKSPEEIKNLSLKCAEILVKEGADEILIACGTICLNALSFLKEKLSVPVYSIIDCGVSVAIEKSENGKVAVIATSASVRSGGFAAAVKRQCEDVELIELSGGELAYRIENDLEVENYFCDIIEPKLKEAFREGCNSLLLGCTHYPHIMELFKKTAGKIPVSDCAEAAAEAIIKLKNREKRRPKLKFLTSSDPEKFREFAEKHINLRGEEIFELRF